MLVYTLFSKVDGKNAFLVEVYSRVASKPRLKASQKNEDDIVLFSDNHVKLLKKSYRNLHDSCVVIYELCYRGYSKDIPPVTMFTWWCCVFYRKSNEDLSGKPFAVAYEDKFVRLITYNGPKNPDYFLVGLHPPPESKHGDARFSTNTRAHKIETEE